MTKRAKCAYNEGMSTETQTTGRDIVQDFSNPATGYKAGYEAHAEGRGYNQVPLPPTGTPVGSGWHLWAKEWQRGLGAAIDDAFFGEGWRR